MNNLTLIFKLENVNATKIIINQNKCVSVKFTMTIKKNIKVIKYKGKIPLTAKQLNTNTHTIRL